MRFLQVDSTTDQNISLPTLHVVTTPDKGEEQPETQKRDEQATTKTGAGRKTTHKGVATTSKKVIAIQVVYIVHF